MCLTRGRKGGVYTCAEFKRSSKYVSDFVLKHRPGGVSFPELLCPGWPSSARWLSDAPAHEGPLCAWGPRADLGEEPTVCLSSHIVSVPKVSMHFCPDSTVTFWCDVSKSSSALVLSPVQRASLKRSAHRSAHAAQEAPFLCVTWTTRNQAGFFLLLFVC